MMWRIEGGWSQLMETVLTALMPTIQQQANRILPQVLRLGAEVTTTITVKAIHIMALAPIGTDIKDLVRRSTTSRTSEDLTPLGSKVRMTTSPRTFKKVQHS